MFHNHVLIVRAKAFKVHTQTRISRQDNSYYKFLLGKNGYF